MMIQIRQATVEDINIIHDLAHSIWPVAYKGMITDEQIEYMLNLIYAPEALQKQMQQHQFVILHDEERNLGFASYSAKQDPSIYKLHKLYVLVEQHGKGLGKMLLDYVIERARNAGATTLELTVNRRNKARTFYEKQGFRIIREEDIDIGNGFVMDDFIMHFALSQVSR